MKNDKKFESSSLVVFSQQDILNFYKKSKLWPFTPLINNVYFSLRRLIGRFSKEDQLKIACICEPPMFFLVNGIMIAHPFGITLSVDEIGCDCFIGQNVTIGTNAKNMDFNGSTTNHKPRIGNLVRIYPQAVISGEIKIADYVLIAAHAIVTKNIPSKSIVYGINQIKPLQRHHFKYLQSMLWSCNTRYVRVPGLMYKDRKLFINHNYLTKREILIKELYSNNFMEELKNI